MSSATQEDYTKLSEELYPNTTEAERWSWTQVCLEIKFLDKMIKTLDKDPESDQSEKLVDQLQERCYERDEMFKRVLLKNPQTSKGKGREN